MSKDSIRLSPRHGVNPSIGVCFFCGKENGDVILPGMLPGDREAPRKAVWTMDPCKECEHWMTQGVIIVSVRDGSQANPERTGNFWVLKDEAIERLEWRKLFGDELIDGILKKRFCFMEDTVCEKLGLKNSD